MGIALGAGAAKGYAHFGVLRVLEAEGVPVDCVVGASIGAQVAFLRALGMDIDEAMNAVDEVASRTVRFSARTSGLLSSGGLRRGLEAFCGDRRIEDTPVALGIVAADLVTRSEIIFCRGLVWPALLASMSIPGIYPAQRFGDRLLVDGGVVNPVPSSAAAVLGADIVVAVSLGSPRSDEYSIAESGPPAGRAPSMATTILRSIEIMQRTIASGGSGAASIVIEPTFDPADGLSLRRFARGRRYVESGSLAAKAALPRLRTVLPWLADSNA